MVYKSWIEAKFIVVFDSARLVWFLYVGFLVLILLNFGCILCLIFSIFFFFAFSVVFLTSGFPYKCLVTII